MSDKLTDEQVRDELTEEEREIYDEAHKKWDSPKFEVMVLGGNLVSLFDSLAACRIELRECREAIRAMMNELGVPGNGYPAPVANAYKIGKAALAAIKKALLPEKGE